METKDEEDFCSGNGAPEPIPTAPTSESSVIKEENESFLDMNRAYLLHYEEHKGGRAYMEDGSAFIENRMWQFFGVFDGHGGAKVAKILEDHFGTALLQKVGNASRPVIVKQRIQEFCLQTDAVISGIKKLQEQGSTLCAVLLDKRARRAYFINIGDSRALLLSQRPRQQRSPLLFATKDHKPDSPTETARIKRAGGTVVSSGVPRVNGRLALSRAIGDATLKLTPKGHYSGSHAPVSAVPDIQVVQLQRNQGYVFVLATDGLWDFASSEAVARTVTTALPNAGKNKEAFRTVIPTRAFRADNITLLLVWLPPRG